MANGLTAGNLIVWSPPSISWRLRVGLSVSCSLAFPSQGIWLAVPSCHMEKPPLTFSHVSPGSWQMPELHRDTWAKAPWLSHCSVPFPVLRCFSWLGQLKIQAISHTQSPQTQLALH